MRATFLIALSLLGCGEEEGIVRVRPVIGVCPTSNPVAGCDAPIDLGSLGIEFGHEVDLFVVDRGEGPLVISSIGGTEVTSELEVPFTVSAGAILPLPLIVTPSVLGPGTALLVIESDDPERPSYSLELAYDGTPKPAPEIVLCADGACGTDVTLDFGAVRRTQRESAAIEVRNAGDAPLTISSVTIEGASAEIAIETPTRPGRIAAGESAELIAVYQPSDPVPDSIVLVFASDDPMHPEARATIRGTTEANAPPLADAREIVTASTSASVLVETLVVLDGSMSRDPEGDPLGFSWTLTAPPRSRAAIDDPAAGLVTFLPDVAGEYRAELIVVDSLGQPSSAAMVTVTAMPRFAFRAIVAWQSGGDLDLSLVGPAGTCDFETPRPSWGAELRSDVEDPPGGEEIVFAAPAAGTYDLWVRYFDDRGLGPATASVDVIFDDASIPAWSGTMTLDQTCSAWHVGAFDYAPSAFTPSTDPVALQCR